ncbi:DUF1801 domain-containing protein [Thalassoglobus sp. JC818]|uniref:DUF1801 domain-containing protein n=1 Tax=Thalassoglobus sp. JC818 TaxID=3232136 RepID=UPI003458B277
MTPTNPQVDEYIQHDTSWADELKELRQLILQCELSEEWKWKIPVYCRNDANVVSICSLKDSCVLSFFKGAMLQDVHKILAKPGENTRAARVIRFTNVDEIAEVASILTSYICEAIALEEAGVKYDFTQAEDVQLPDEAQEIFAKTPELKQAFESLTPGRRRAYAMFFTAPKQSKTRVSRVQKSIDKILDGKGLNDCTCGLSKRMPSCDGSHKSLK